MSKKKQEARPAFVALSLENDTDVLRVQRHLRRVFEDHDVEGIEWQAAPTFHITLAYAYGIADPILDMVAERIVPAIKAVSIDAIETGIFENGEERALYIKVTPTDELKELQSYIYNVLEYYGIEMSEYSDPDNWQPHITLAYLPSGVDDPLVDVDVYTVSRTVSIGRDDYDPYAIIRAPELILKQKQSGSRYALIVTTNAYKDKHREIIKEAALKQWVDRQWLDGDFYSDNPLLYWHGGEPIGDIVWADMQGPFLIEIAQERPNATINIAKAHEPPVYINIRDVWDALEEVPGMGASHEFKYIPVDREDGVYELIVKKETTALPRGDAANELTHFEVLKGL